MLNPVHLHTLITVLRTGSFADAARRLGYTSSAVSQQMSSLERVVRTPLFEREAHSVRPTPTAELLAARSGDVLAGLTSLERDVEGLVAGSVGRIRIGSFPTASRRIVPEWLAGHHRDRPGIEIVLDEDEPTGLLARLQSGGLDLVLVYRYDLVPHPWPAGVRRVRLLEEELVLLLPAGHRLAETERVVVADLAGETWVSTRETSDGAACLDRVCAVEDFTPQVAYRSNDYGVVRGFVRAGLGIAVVPSLGWEPTPGVVARPLSDLAARRHLFAVHRKTGVQPAVTTVVADLVAVTERILDQAPDALPS